jgi:deoxyribodipyrimidine photo-lyase
MFVSEDNIMDISDRVRSLKKGPPKSGPIIYWMGRDQRVRDNWALIYAQEKALEYKVPLVVAFNLVPTFLDATIRQYDFMLKGLESVSEDLAKKQIPFCLLLGDPKKNIPDFVKEIGAGLLICDFEPLRIKQTWKKGVAKKIDIPFEEVDARNIVPCWIASPKQEFGAYTIRPKIHRLLDDYIEECPALKKHPYPLKQRKNAIDWKGVKKKLDVDMTVPPVGWLKPGEKAAHKKLQEFVKGGLARYESDRNDPTRNGQSNLSPYLHFGQIASLRIAIETLKSNAPKSCKDAFIEELVVRRELSDNFCFYNTNYDNYKCLPEWARKSLDKHKKDRREYRYSIKILEEAKTHDEAWNAAQREMVARGKMHGYMRMYWAKKILEWSASPEKAIRNAIYLNDRYELDGRDTNGYAGIMWSIGGLHDRAWGERPIFGKIRYMSYNGLKSKFDMDKYIGG